MASHAADPADLDALYRAPLGEFIAQRNGLAARLRAEQGKDAAAAVKALAKPSGTAWVVNQLFWRHGREFERLMNTGSALRVAQQARLAGRAGADVSAAVEARDEALAALMARVRDLLAEAGLSAGAAMRQRVSITLEALSIYGGLDAGPRAGRLTVDVDPPGFAALGALVPPGRGPMPRPAARPVSPGKIPSPESRIPSQSNTGPREAVPRRPAPRQVGTQRIAEAKSAFVRARTDADQARFAAKAADTAQRRADTAWQQAKTAADEAQRQLDAALERTRTAEERRDEALRAAESAREVAARAARLRDEAERTYRALLER